MQEINKLDCPVCHSNYFILRYEASHVYSYVIDTDAPGLKNTEEFLSFKYDNRELTDSEQYLECQKCKSKFPCDFNQWHQNIGFKALQDILHKGYTGF